MLLLCVTLVDARLGGHEERNRKIHCFDPSLRVTRRPLAVVLVTVVPANVLEAGAA